MSRPKGPPTAASLLEALKDLVDREPTAVTAVQMAFEIGVAEGRVNAAISILENLKSSQQRP
jgi:DNA-binding SARP family transcriptional activator